MTPSKTKVDRSREEVPYKAAGFMHVPPLWVMSDPPETGVRKDTPGRDDVVYVGDVPDSGIRLQVFRDGLFVFDLEDWRDDLSVGTLEPQRQERTRRRCALLNAYLCALHTARAMHGEVLIEKMLVTPKVLTLSTGLDSTRFGVSDGISRSVISTDKRGAEGWGDGRSVQDFWFGLALQLNETTLDRASELLGSYVETNSLFNIRILELCLRSCAALEEF
jgi:hypothetical protein